LPAHISSWVASSRLELVGVEPRNQPGDPLGVQPRARLEALLHKRDAVLRHRLKAEDRLPGPGRVFPAKVLPKVIDLVRGNVLDGEPPLGVGT